MHPATLAALACPSCRTGYRLVSRREQGDHVLDGHLQCPGCATVVPIVEGFAFFTEALMHAGQAEPPALRALGERLFGTSAQFDAYRREKHARGLIEAYAAFQPFNEATRALEPLLPYLDAQLQPGDLIVDAWCRTGWSGEWLAGRFPQQRVLALWEGDHSVLGYRGFRHLLPVGQRASNLDIVFAHPDRPLPLRDGAAGLLHALDALHRHAVYPFAAECLRVAHPDAPIVFPHLHLTNSEPDPWFERGCRQQHGRDYRRWLDEVGRAGARRGWVFSEAALFDGPCPAPLRDDADTGHYNGLACLMRPVAPAARPMATLDDPRYVVNPLLRFNLGRASARIAPAQFDGAVGDLLARHPVYRRRLPEGALALGRHGALLLCLAAAGLSRRALQAVMPQAEDAVTATLDHLVAAEVLRPAPVSLAAHRLQRFHANQLAPAHPATLAGFWTGIDACDRPLWQLPDGQSVSGTDLAQWHAPLAASLAALGAGPGRPVSVDAGANPLLWAVALLAARSGIEVRLRGAGEAGAAGSALHLHGDGAAPGDGVPSIALGLDGRDDGLLARLAAVEIPEAPGPTGAAPIRVPLGAGDAVCALADLVDGCASLAQQVEPQLWMLQGSDPAADLLACLCALWRLEPVQAMTAGG